jgi:hypothetical protein
MTTTPGSRRLGLGHLQGLAPGVAQRLDQRAAHGHAVGVLLHVGGDELLQQVGVQLGEGRAAAPQVGLQRGQQLGHDVLRVGEQAVGAIALAGADGRFALGHVPHEALVQHHDQAPGRSRADRVAEVAVAQQLVGHLSIPASFTGVS